MEKSRSIRFQGAKEPTTYSDSSIKIKYKVDGAQLQGKMEVPTAGKKSLKSKVLSRVFSEDYGKTATEKTALDPRGTRVRRWNTVFLLASLVSLFLDPLFFYLPVVGSEVCIGINMSSELILTFVRSLVDVFYAIQIFVRFRTAYIAPSSRVFGRGELVIDPSKIASRYLKKGFWLDFVVALPLPQFLIWVVMPSLGASRMATTDTKNALRFILIVQYLPRLYLIAPLTSQIAKASGFMTVRAWAGAAYNLALYMLASHVLGSCWYLLSVDRQEACWRSICGKTEGCESSFFDCRRTNVPERGSWFESTNLTNLCGPSSPDFNFGIYEDALSSGVTSAPFIQKYFYCLWWGLRQLSSLGQNLSTSTYIQEMVFAIIIATLGLVLFALLIGNMQRFLQSTTVRLEEWRLKRADTERWMRHRQLPTELRLSVRKYDQYKWIATRGVDEEALLKGLPLDIRRDIKRHLCFDLVRRVPLFEQMDERMLDAICERLKPALSTQGTFLMREGDPVNEMLFIIRGHLDSFTTNGGRSGFFNTCRIGPGDFCGEELLTWALDPRPGAALASSTRTVRAISEVEAFALRAGDLMFVASQFRRLHSKVLRHKFRFHSHQWRTWAACFVQAAWRRYKKRREAAELFARESLPPESSSDAAVAGSGVGMAAYAARRTSRSRRSAAVNDSGTDPGVVSPLQKPAEPDFSVGEDS